jgi:hypothetical protein
MRNQTHPVAILIDKVVYVHFDIRRVRLEGPDQGGREFSWANDVSPLCQAAAGKSKASLLPIRHMKINKLKETQTSILFKPLNILFTQRHLTFLL